ncbi:MAG: pentapeptide repeat-containing protein [Synechococcaceae cyanobacterium]|nr:pentapeptide repeat-containing protein [Synechococcaceae cyanobacterium]
MSSEREVGSPLPAASPALLEGAEATPPFRGSGAWSRFNQSAGLQLVLALTLTLAGLVLGWAPLTLVAGGLTLALSLLQLLPPLVRRLAGRLDDLPTTRVLAGAGLVLAAVALPVALGWWEPVLDLYRTRNWEAIGALGEGVIGAFGQILVALVALFIAWRQVMVDMRLTTQQNRITEAQTIDSFIHGISEMIIDEEGMLEDWPLERMLAEGRLAAVLSSIEPEGKAKVLRFLSHARLLTPLRRDHRLGRAILDGEGNYEEDRFDGVPVIRLQQILRGADLAGCDLRGVDFNGADLRGADLSGADLREAILAGANLGGANLSGARLEGARFFWGRAQTASPQRPGLRPDPRTGASSGAVVENVNLSGVRQLDPQAHFYLASWSGSRSRASLPGGSKGIANQLERPSGMGN